jgi:acetolactate synthase-1/2/3 large subunit
LNGADILCETLLANEIDTCFANPGTSEMHFVAALDRKPQMRCVLGLSEGVVTGAADGYARMADKPAATLLHLGPGLANGLANIHNARRANTPMVNIVGDHATYHLAHDAPLTTDIESLAKPMSHRVRRIANAADVSKACAEAVSVAMTPPGQIATLILPADAAWGEAPETISTAEPVPAWRPGEGRIREAADAIHSGMQSGADTVMLLSGKALRGKALEIAGRIARATGIRIMAQQSNARVERGAGRVVIDRVPYSVDRALACFADTRQVILVGARAPVAFFAYPGKPSSVLPEQCRVLEAAGPGDDLQSALEALAELIHVGRDVTALVGERVRPELPGGTLTTAAIARALAVLSPEGAILCDESVSSGREFFPATYGAAPHDFLQLTGGAIGLGLPMAVGASIACPDRKVIGLQADGSAMYTVQALWTQARESLDVVTVIFANRSYRILHNELQMVGASEPGRNARRMLDLVEPALDWVHLAMGLGVEAARANDAAQFNDLLRQAVARRGPFLIEAVI